MQKSLDTWQGTLYTTGGALDWGDKDKCYWYCIHYVWNTKGRWQYASPNNHYQLTMNDNKGGRKPVYGCTPAEARRTLGVYLAPDGNMTLQLSKMLEQSTKFGTRLKNSRLSGCDALLAMNSQILRTQDTRIPPSNNKFDRK